MGKLCPSIKCSLSSLLGFCQFTQARYYTISSSSSLYPDTVHLTVAMTEAVRPDGTLFRGLCSGYLSDAKIGDRIRLYNRPSTFRLPTDISRPIIMIGPGTGIAPMRALLQERAYRASCISTSSNREQNNNNNYN